jgi:riboflavin synthase
MFTGLVEELGVVDSANTVGPGVRLVIKCPLVATDASLGDSISVNGCCLTVVKADKGTLAFDVGDESLSRTTFGRMAKGSRVNLERSLQLGDRLGGHLVTGHIDGTGTLIKRRDDEDWASLTFRCPMRMTRQMAAKGSVALDGVSLTLVNVEDDRFSVMIIPHTQEKTTLGKLSVGNLVNVETDLLAKYVERQLESRQVDRSVL